MSIIPVKSQKIYQHGKCVICGYEIRYSEPWCQEEDTGRKAHLHCQFLEPNPKKKLKVKKR